MTPEQWQRYIDKQGTEQERKEGLQYLQSLSPDMLEEQISDQWGAEARSMPEDIALRMDRYIESVIVAGKDQKRRISYRWRYWAAASIIGIAVACFSLVKVFLPQRPQEATAVQYKTINNTSTHVQKLTLPDSSQVWLTPQSMLRLSADYATGSRTVLLEGEAYFEIAHHAAQPFVVQTGTVSTTVLGTHFNIEAYNKETGIHISLTQGKVAVKIKERNGQDSTLYLTPGNRLVYRTDKQLFHTEKLASLDEAEWKGGTIVLNDLSVQEVFQRLEQRFGKKIMYTPGLFKGKRFTATYPQTNLDLILQNMAFVQGFRYKIKSDSVFIH